MKGVTNEISLEPKVAAADVKTKIENALKRSAQIDASHISVGAEHGKVTLNGTVRSWSEREEAEDAAFAAPGVMSVENLITIQSNARGTVAPCVATSLALLTPATVEVVLDKSDSDKSTAKKIQRRYYDVAKRKCCCSHL